MFNKRSFFLLVVQVLPPRSRSRGATSNAQHRGHPNSNQLSPSRPRSGAPERREAAPRPRFSLPLSKEEIDDVFDGPERSSDSMADADLISSRRGCCFFWVPYFGSDNQSSSKGAHGRGEWERISGGSGSSDLGAPAEHFHDDAWWRRALMRMREWSEIVAGPRWKTFIRRFRRHRRSASYGGCGGARAGKTFQYDPLSYALNFDEGPYGHGGGDANEEYVYRDFSAWYVLPPSSAKSSMDLGGRDAPSLFHPAYLKPPSPQMRPGNACDPRAPSHWRNFGNRA